MKGLMCVRKQFFNSIRQLPSFMLKLKNEHSQFRVKNEIRLFRGKGYLGLYIVGLRFNGDLRTLLVVNCRFWGLDRSGRFQFNPLDKLDRYSRSKQDFLPSLKKK